MCACLKLYNPWLYIFFEFDFSWPSNFYAKKAPLEKIDLK